jgi:hypothetical protein
MTPQQFLLSMDELLELPAGTLTGGEKLEALEQWNSMAMIGFIALVDTNSGLKISPRQIGACETVDDLLRLANLEAASGQR